MTLLSGIATLLFVLFMHTSDASLGTEFHLMFMDNQVEDVSDEFDPSEEFLALQVSNPHEASTEVNVFMPHEPKWAGFSSTLAGMSSVRVPVPLYAMHRRPGRDDKGIEVNSTLPVAVTGVNKQKWSTDSYLALPRSSLGVSYTGACFTANIRTQIGFTATLDNTSIVITLPPLHGIDKPEFHISIAHEGSFFAAGQRFTVRLNMHETYLLTTRGDLTGTQIRSNKRISVFGGNVRAKLAGRSRDHLVEQLLPIYSWGKYHFTTSTPGRTMFDVYRILVKHSQTDVSIQSYPQSNITELRGLSNSSYDSVRFASGSRLSFNCTSECFVYQISPSTERREAGDPSMLTIPAMKQWQNNYIFIPPLTSKNEPYTNYLIVIMPEDDGLTINGLPYNDDWGTFLPGTSVMKTVEIKITTTWTMRIRSMNGAKFYAVLYGATDRESYAHPLGIELRSPTCLESRAVVIAGDGVDNDCDSFTDEEELNGKDDDGDGLIDEDTKASTNNLSSGREYIVMFMENRVEKSQNISLGLFIGSLSHDHVTNVYVTWRVQNTLSQEYASVNVTVQPYTTEKIQIDNSLMQRGLGRAFKAIRVYADDDIVVYGVNKQPWSADGFLALPVQTLGKEYFTVSHYPSTTGTQFSIVAVNDSTHVMIDLPALTPDHFDEVIKVVYNNQEYTNGGKFSVTLQRYETFQIQTSRPDAGDLSGTNIRSDKPIAVFAGNIRTFVHSGTDGASRDHLVEQMPPVHAYGRNFATMTTPNRTVGDEYKIIVSSNNTYIKVCEKNSTFVNGTCWTEFIATRGTHLKLNITDSMTYMYINSSHPIMIVQITRSQITNLTNMQHADPAMFIIPPVEQYTNNYTFLTPTVANTTVVASYVFHWLMIVINGSFSQGLILDGNDTALEAVPWETIPYSDGLVAGAVNVQSGLHFLNHSDPTAHFMGLLYGVADRESYGFPIGLRLDALSFCNPTSQIDGDNIDNDCDGRVDEEICGNNIDDDSDGKEDEDCSKLPDQYSYYVVFMENSVEDPLYYPLRVIGCSAVNTTARIRTPLYSFQSSKYDYNTAVLSDEILDFGLRSDIKQRGSGKSNRGVLIQSDAWLTLYGSNKEKFSHDAFLILEAGQLGKEYMSVHYSPSLLAEEFAFTPVEDNTVATIQLSVGLRGQVYFGGHYHSAGQVFSVQLNVGESVQVQSREGGLSGTFVRADKNIALFSGNVRTYVGSSRSRDHLVEQLLPLENWGQRYVAPTTPDRTEPDVFIFVTKVAASLINVTSSSTGVVTTHSIRGYEALELNLPSEGRHYRLESEHPFQAVRVTRSQVDFNELADPSMLLLVAEQSWPTRVSFSPPLYSGGLAGGDYVNTLQIVVSTSKRDGLQLNGKGLDVEWSDGAYPNYSVGQIMLANTESKFLLEHTDGVPFMAYLYGAADRESYALPLGLMTN